MSFASAPVIGCRKADRHERRLGVAKRPTAAGPERLAIEPSDGLDPATSGHPPVGPNLLRSGRSFKCGCRSVLTSDLGDQSFGSAELRDIEMREFPNEEMKFATTRNPRHLTRLPFGAVSLSVMPVRR